MSATCHIKYSKNHYTYMQPLTNHTEDDLLNNEKDECIVPRSSMYSSPEILGGIHKNLIPLYSLVMIKHNSKVKLLATNKKSTRISDEDSLVFKIPHSSKLQNNY